MSVLLEDAFFKATDNGEILQDLFSRLESFTIYQQAIMKNSENIAKFTDLEAACYRANKRAAYYAQDAMISIFTDLTERSPTFGLSPIDTVGTATKKSWIAMFTDGTDKYNAWERFLGRRFKGLDQDAFLPEFQKIEDPELKHKGIVSLAKTGRDQEDLYDFSLS